MDTVTYEKQSRRPVIYISGPYRGTEVEVHRNIQRAELNAMRFWENGFIALCPHKNTAYFGGLVSDEVFLEGALELMTRCDALFLPFDWHNSIGTVEERAVAYKINLPIISSVREAKELFRL